ncbi:MAG: dockerin type I repeat-containing protein [Oscillospiraceae bacterium]|jgi:hypothetical protein|nr:dockerin type I repeat-containing protein [Oscillospiraceae bacterium]
MISTKKYFKLPLLSLLIIVIIISILAALPVSSADDGSLGTDGFIVTIEMDKPFHNEGETPGIIVTIENTNPFLVKSVTIEHIIPEGFTLHGIESLEETRDFAAGEVYEIKMTVSVDESNDSGDDGTAPPVVTTPLPGDDGDTTPPVTTPPPPGDSNNLIPGDGDGDDSAPPDDSVTPPPGGGSTTPPRGGGGGRSGGTTPLENNDTTPSAENSDIKETNTRKLGDVNGDGTLTTSDALLILQFIAGFKLDIFFEDVADVNGNEKIDTPDAMEILRRIAGLPSRYLDSVWDVRSNPRLKTYISESADLSDSGINFKMILIIISICIIAAGIILLIKFKNKLPKKAIKLSGIFMCVLLAVSIFANITSSADILSFETAEIITVGEIEFTYTIKLSYSALAQTNSGGNLYGVYYLLSLNEIRANLKEQEDLGLW